MSRSKYWQIAHFWSCVFLVTEPGKVIKKIISQTLFAKKLSNLARGMSIYRSIFLSKDFTMAHILRDLQGFKPGLIFFGKDLIS